MVHVASDVSSLPAHTTAVLLGETEPENYVPGPGPCRRIGTAGRSLWHRGPAVFLFSRFLVWLLGCLQLCGGYL